MKQLILALILIYLEPAAFATQLTSADSRSIISTRFSFEPKIAQHALPQGMTAYAIGAKKTMAHLIETTPFITKINKEDGEKLAPNVSRFFVGIGNTNVIADIVTLTDNSFLGELGQQIRGGVMLKNNYELNFGVYWRNCPGISRFPGYNYSKFSGVSTALMYEFKKQGSRWGVPIGLEVLSYTKNFTYTNEGKNFYDNYKAFSYGPKIGLRYHVSALYFVEAECEALYEHFTSEVNWGEKETIKANKIGSFKFIGLSFNRRI